MLGLGLHGIIHIVMDDDIVVCKFEAECLPQCCHEAAAAY